MCIHCTNWKDRTYTTYPMTLSHFLTCSKLGWHIYRHNGTTRGVTAWPPLCGAWGEWSWRSNSHRHGLSRGGKWTLAHTRHCTDVTDTTNFSNPVYLDMAVTHPQAGKHGYVQLAARGLMWAYTHRMYEGLKHDYETDDPVTPWPIWLRFALHIALYISSD